MTDGEITKLFELRDESAVAETQKAFGKYCEKIARNILENEQEVQDCVNEVYFKVWESIPPERPRSLAAYLAKITRNAALSRYRKNSAEKRGGGRVPLILDELSELVSDGMSVEQTFERRELIAEINRFLETLPDRNRQIFIGRFVLCESVRDIAKRFGMTANGVSVNINRTKKQLRKHLIKEGYEL